MIKLIPHNIKWTDAFNQLSELLLSNPKNVFLKIEHIGSTSIQDAPAKDIVDIQCAIDSFDKINQVKSFLEPLGFAYYEFNQDHVPFHAHDYFNPAWEKRFFSGTYKGQQFNIHVRLYNSLNWKFALQFKDYMNSNVEARIAYMQFKERLASSKAERDDYCLIKDSVIDLLSLQFFKP
ncbi:TPA: GrpB family protein [Legionella pneumophila]|nr:GrpB family protein [Legionella pneumophila]HAU0358586.1 GrpB family protein [Legionella pneumophila]HAU0567134.1 GrpB family protein [Legionella pneumophila]